MSKKDVFINKINARLKDFKDEFDPSEGETKGAEVIIKYAPEVSALCAVYDGALETMIQWITSGEENNLAAIDQLKSIGISMPIELGYIFLIGIEDEIKKIVADIVGDTLPSLLLDKHQPPLA